MHAFGFLELKVPTVRQSSGSVPVVALRHSAPLNHSSCGRNQRTVESPFTLPTRIPSTASPFSSFPVWETPVQLNSVMKRIDLKICPVFLCWVQCCIFLYFVELWFLNGKSCQGRGPEQRPKAFFLLKFLFRRRVGLLLPFLKNIMRKHGGKASSCCSSSLALFLDCVEVIFYH